MAVGYTYDALSDSVARSNMCKSYPFVSGTKTYLDRPCGRLGKEEHVARLMKRQSQMTAISWQ